MKVLVYGINYSPELIGIGKYTGELAASLAAAGHDVRVITAPPYYPGWAVWPNYSAWRYTRERLEGVLVFRTPLWVPPKVSGLYRVLHLASFAIASAPALLAQWRWKPHVIWVVEPALFCAPAALVLAKLSSATAWLHIQDFEVDAAFELGLLRGKRLRALATAIERWLMARFDRVSTISQRMLERAQTKGIDDARLVSLPNWADIAAIRPLTSPSPYRRQLNIADDSIVALYSGNMNAKQGLELLADAAEILYGYDTVQFVFCGNGAGRAELMRRCCLIGNVRFLDLQPVDRLGDLLGLADVHLLPQRADAADLVMPSKLCGILSSGRPVVATARSETELGKVAALCGIVVPPENPKAFADAIVCLATQPELRKQLGACARAYAERQFARGVVLGQFERDLRACHAPRL